MQPRYNPQMMAPIERKQALARMNPQTAPVAANNIFGNQMQENNEAFLQARERGEDGAPMIQKAQNLAPLNFLENTVGMDPAQREAILGMPMPRADTGEGRFAPQPSQPPDPFSGGYKPRGKGDPYGPLPPRPRNFAMGGTVGALPTPDELTAEMGGKPWSWTHSGPSQFSPFKDMMPDLGRRTNQFSTGGTIEGPGGPTDDMIPGVVDGQMPVRLSNGERVQKASTRDWLGEKFFVDLDKKADKERAEFEADKLRPKSRHRAYPMPVLDAETSMPIPGYAEGGTVLANNPDEQEFGLRRLATNPYGSGYSVTPLPLPLPTASAAPIQPEPQFQSDPDVLASLRQRRRGLRTMPEFDQGQQPAINVASPMEPPTMRRAPMTMTEKDRLNMPLRPSVTPQVDPDFEATLVGQSGMGKRRARAAYLQEQALWNRDDKRQQGKDAAAATRAQQNRALDFAEWQQKQVIGDQFQQAAENRRIGTTAALIAADDQQKQAAAAAAAEANRRFSPVLDADGNPIPGRMMNPQGQQLNTEPQRAEGIRMEPVPGMPGRVLPMMGGSRVPGMPMMQANTAPGPFREGLGRTTFTPVQETEPAKAPTVRKTAPRKGFSAEAPEWEYASLSDGSTRPITIDNPLPTQTKERFQHQYGRAPQTEQEWTEAWYLTTGQPMPAGTVKPAAASAAAAPQRAKIKSATLISAPAK